MKAFAELLDRLVYTPSRTGKLRLISDYFRATPDPDRGWALAALTDGLDFSLPVRRLVMELIERRVDPELFRLSRDYVGDTAETVALIWPQSETETLPPTLSEIVREIGASDRARLGSHLAAWLDALDASGRFALLKLLTGALRVGVSARLAKTALAGLGSRPVEDIEEVWHSLAPPYAELFAWLEGRGPRPEHRGGAAFRPVMLAHPLEAEDWRRLDLAEFAAEWKWDGIRVQVAASGGEVRLFTRTGEDIGRAFPDVLASFRSDVILDGELLIVREGIVQPFNALQQRLNRKTVTRRMLADYPAHIRFYDALSIDGADLRALPFLTRRRRLETWHAAVRPPRTDLSELIEAADKAALAALRDGARQAAIEGLMLKRRDSPYIAGRPKGHWFKWKRAPLTVDCVLMYAQRGSGKRSSFYSDFTFGLWRSSATGEDELVPVGKAYSGFTDAELLALDRFVRANTVERFGPVRAVTPALVFEIAFDAVQRSPRHKSGIALRFPRIARIRWDKPAREADRVSTLESYIEM